MSWTYTDEDVKRVVDSVANPKMKTLVQLLFDCAYEGSGLNEDEFVFIEQFCKELE